MLSDSEYALYKNVSSQILNYEEWLEKKRREALANDGIVAFMQSLDCEGCGFPITQCRCAELEDIVARTISAPSVRYVDVPTQRYCSECGLPDEAGCKCLPFADPHEVGE